MPIPCEVVGSFPRSTKLLRAIAAYEAKQIAFEQLEREMDASCAEYIRRMEDAGHIVVTDGEQRFSSVAKYPLIDTLNGTGTSENLVFDGQYFSMQVHFLAATFQDGYHRHLPRLVSGPFRYKTFAADYLERVIPVAQHLVKQAVVAPSLLSLLYPPRSDVPGYTRQQFLTDLCDQAELDIRKCFQAGAVRVSIDFTEGQLNLRNWTNPSERLLDFFIDLNNRVINRFTAGERAHIGVHTCCRASEEQFLPYEELVKEMFKMNAGYFLIHCAAERDRNRILKLVGKNIRRDANGVKQMAYIGVTSTVDPRIETPEEIAQMLVSATKYIPTDQLGATDEVVWGISDCGFACFCDDARTKHSLNPDNARDIAFQKIVARVKGARIASERLGA
ncbi:methionine synthase vitamin-B12 independent protein [Ceratobasidium sp. AG-Ba]|nr:methionine synthase vitamin-B12 independent protein [Ceratobasidium sp. AG-Ba]